MNAALRKRAVRYPIHDVATTTCTLEFTTLTYSLSTKERCKGVQTCKSKGIHHGTHAQRREQSHINPVVWNWPCLLVVLSSSMKMKGCAQRPRTWFSVFSARQPLSPQDPSVRLILFCVFHLDPLGIAKAFLLSGMDPENHLPARWVSGTTPGHGDQAGAKREPGRSESGTRP